MTGRPSARWLAWLAYLALLLSGAAFAQGVEVQTLDGRKAGLGEFIAKDKWTLVMVWTTYCGICRAQYPIISEFHSKHADTDAVVVGISLDGYGEAGKVADYQKARAHSFPSVLAEADTFAKGYERTTGETFTGTPTYLMFDRQGRLVAYIDGPVSLAALEKSIAR